MHSYERWSDEDLALAFRAGDLASGEALLHRYARFVYALAGRFGVSDEDSGDIFTDVWLKLQDQIGGYRQRSGFRAYLRMVVRSVVIDRARRQKRHTGHLSLEAPQGPEDEAPLHELVPDAGNLEQTIIDHELLDMVQRAVRELPDRFQVPLVMYYRDGLGHATIAERLGIPKNTVTTRIHRGREQVRRQVDRWLGE